jgi:thiol-disulfide isomerase/thioredoxin
MQGAIERAQRAGRPGAICAAAAALLLGLAHARGARSDAGQGGLQVGSAMVDFGLRSLDLASGKLGAAVWLSDFVGGDGGASVAPRKRLLLLNFFAAWCKPCVAELPVLSALQQAHAARGLQVVSVYHRQEGEPLERAIAQTREQLGGSKLPFPLLFDRYTSRNQRLYLGERSALPCNVLITSDGRIAARFQGGRAALDGSLEAAVLRLMEGAP